MKALLLLASALLLAGASTAYAEPVEPTAQARAAGAEFLLWAAPPGPSAAICLVDTGVNATPDTASVIARQSIYGLDGADQSPSLHGTRMAMLLAGAQNNWGTIGFWPSVPIVSIQANQAGQDVFATSAYLTGMDMCTELSSVYPIKVTLVSLASEVPLSQQQAGQLHEILEQTRLRGINVVIAAGNLDGRPVGTPANVAGAFSIGASDASAGTLCASSATGALLLAPGCAIDSADPSSGTASTSQEGTSAAAAFTAAGVAALRTWRPDLLPQDVERLLNESATPSVAGRRLNLAAAFSNAGLQSVTQPPAPPPPPPPPPPVAKAQLVKPRVQVRFKRRVLTIRSSNRPAGSRMVVRVYAKTSRGKLRKVAAQTRASRTVKFRLRRWTRVTVRFTDPTGRRTDSAVAKVTRRR
jgi:hypothetical protein